MSLIKIKRSSGSAAPGVIELGELAYSYGAGLVSDGGGRLYFGTGSNATQIVGGKYFTDMLDHTPGTLTASSALLVDSNSKLGNLKVDDLDFNGSTISTTTTDTDLIFDTNGTGDYIFSGSTTAGANLLAVTDGTNTRLSVDSFSGAISITAPSLDTASALINATATWNGSDQTFYGINLDVTNTASDPTSRLIDLMVGGSSKFSVDTEGNVAFAGTISTTGDNSIASIAISDNTAPAFVVKEGTNEYIRINTTNGSELTTIGNDLTTLNLVIEDNTASAFAIKEGTNVYFKIDTTDGSELTTINTANVVIANDLSVNGGDLTSTQTTFNMLNTTVTTLNLGGAATTTNIGAAGSAGILTLKNDTVKIDGTLQVNDSITTNVTTVNLLNTTATTVNFGGAAIAMSIGDAAGTVTFNNDVVITGDLTVNGDAVTVNTTSLAVEDPLIRLATGNTTTDALDIGFVGSYGSSGETYTGFFRDASNDEYYLFNGAPTTALANNIIDRNAVGFALAKVNASEFVGSIDGGTY